MNNYEISKKELEVLQIELINLPNDLQVAKNENDFERVAFLKNRSEKLDGEIFIASLKASKAHINKLQDEVRELKKTLLDAQQTQLKRDAEISVELQMHQSKLFELKDESLRLMFAGSRLKDAIAAKENLIFSLNKTLQAV
jgi:uncharacterized protein YdcH (DUF465 family)